MTARMLGRRFGMGGVVFDETLDLGDGFERLAAFGEVDQEFLDVEGVAVAEMREFAAFVQAEVIAVVLQDARLEVVGEIGSDHLRENLSEQERILDAEDHFHALVDISLHPIGAAEEKLGLAAVAEDEDAAVFEKSPDHAAHADAAAEAANAGAEGA